MTDSITPSLRMNNSDNSIPSCRRPVLSRFQLDAEKARRSPYEFVVQGWPVLEPDVPLVDACVWPEPDL